MKNKFLNLTSNLDEIMPGQGGNGVNRSCTHSASALSLGLTRASTGATLILALHGVTIR